MMDVQPNPRANPAAILAPNNRKERRAREAEIRRFLKSENKPVSAIKSNRIDK